MTSLQCSDGGVQAKWKSLSNGKGLIVPAARLASRGRVVLGCPALSRVAGWLLFLLLVIGVSTQINAQSVTLAWNPCSDPSVTGYIVCWGTDSGNYTDSEDAGPVTVNTISNLAAGTTYYFAVTAYNVAGLQSPYSTEVVYLVPGGTPPSGTAFTFSNLIQTYNGAPESVTVTASPADQPIIVTYNGSTNPPINAGAYTVVATAQSPASGSATTTFIINPATAGVSLRNLRPTYTGSQITVMPTTTPGGLAVNTTYNGSAVAPTASGTYLIVATVNNTNYTGSATGTLIISPVSATVTLKNLSRTYTGNPLPVKVTTTPSGLTVNTTYNGSALAPTDSGTYLVVATVKDSNYAGSATNTLVISPVSATVALRNLSTTYTGNPLPVRVTTTPGGLAVNTTYNGSAVAPTDSGTYLVVATVNDSNYSGSATGTLVISPVAATVTLSGLAATYNGGAQAVTVTTSPAGLATTTTYNGSAAAPVNAGSFAVVSTIKDKNYTGSATGTLLISPAAIIYSVTTQINPASAGSVAGSGSYVSGSLVTLTAIANSGYLFANWTEDGTVQSISPNYSFTPDASLNLVANFTSNSASSNSTVPIPVLNGSFESPAVGQGTPGGMPDGWLPSNEDPCGVYNPAAGIYTNVVNDILPLPADGAQLLWISASNYVAQFLTNTLQASQTYTLSGAIGSRADGNGLAPSDQAYVDLLAGDTIIAENFNLPHPAPGTFLSWSINYTAPATDFPSGPLEIRLGQNGGGEADFDNITLTMTVPGGSTPLASSTTTLTSSQNPAPAGSVVTFTAAVSGNGGMPTGSVTFFDGTNNLGAGTLDSLALAAFSATGLSAGDSPHSITAVYSGDSAFAGSTSSVLSQIITNTVPSDTGDPAPGASATTTLANANFEIPAGEQGTVEGVPAGWVASNLDPYGVYNPAVGVYLNETNDILPSPVGSSQLLWIKAGNYVAQFLTNTLQPNQTYTLSGAIGNRGDGYGMVPSDRAYVDLVAGDTIIAENYNLPHPAPGTFLSWAITYTAPAEGFPSGPLQIRLGQHGVGEVDFGNILLTMTPSASTADATDSPTNATSISTNATSGTTDSTSATTATAQPQADTNSNIPNPFAPAAATYYGLFCVPDNVADESSGAVNVTVTTNGTFSSMLRMAAASCPFSGQFSDSGAALVSIPSAGLNPLTVQLQLSLTNGPLTGTVSDGTWTANLFAEPAVYSSANPAPQAGAYALVLPGSGDASAQTGGSGSGTVTVSDSGNATFSGTLDDGTPVTATGTVTAQGLWPFYLSLPGGQGSIFGWLSFTNPASGAALGTTASGSAPPSPAQ